MAAGDIIFWSDVADAIRPPITRLVQQAVQSAANATNAAITFGAGSEEIDTHGFHDTAVNPTRITPTKAGRYRAAGTVNMAATGAVTILAAFIGKNGASVQPFVRMKPNATASTPASSATAIVEMNGTTDYVELFVNQTSGGALNTQASGGVNSVLELEYLGVQ
jgi:hypothetical protein